MARLIGKTGSWLTWLAGSLLALVFGSAGCGRSEPPVAKYGPPPLPPAPPPAEAPEAVPEVALEETPEWQAVLAAFRPGDEAGTLASAEGRLCLEAFEAIAKLRSRGLLTSQEAQLLKIEVERRNRDYLIASTCYDTVSVLPQQESLDRLKARLPLIRELVAAGKIHRSAAHRILGAVEDDLEALSEEATLVTLGARLSEAEKTRDAVKAEIEKLKALLSKTGG